MRLYHATQNGMQFKIYGLFISGIHHLIFSDHNWLQVTETAKSETTDREGDYCNQLWTSNLAKYEKNY